jgi:hypothetical protein
VVDRRAQVGKFLVIDYLVAIACGAASLVVSIGLT